MTDTRTEDLLNAALLSAFKLRDRLVHTDRNSDRAQFALDHLECLAREGVK